jgi:hypothetical protein
LLLAYTNGTVIWIDKELPGGSVVRIYFGRMSGSKFIYYTLTQIIEHLEYNEKGSNFSKEVIKQILQGIKEALTSIGGLNFDNEALASDIVGAVIESNRMLKKNANGISDWDLWDREYAGLNKLGKFIKHSIIGGYIATKMKVRKSDDETELADNRKIGFAVSYANENNSYGLFLYIPGSFQTSIIDLVGVANLV